MVERVILAVHSLAEVVQNGREVYSITYAKGKIYV